MALLSVPLFEETKQYCHEHIYNMKQKYAILKHSIAQGRERCIAWLYTYKETTGPPLTGALLLLKNKAWTLPS